MSNTLKFQVRGDDIFLLVVLVAIFFTLLFGPLTATQNTSTSTTPSVMHCLYGRVHWTGQPMERVFRMEVVDHVPALVRRGEYGVYVACPGRADFIGAVMADTSLAYPNS